MVERACKGRSPIVISRVFPSFLADIPQTLTTPGRGDDVLLTMQIVLGASVVVAVVVVVGAEVVVEVFVPFVAFDAVVVVVGASVVVVVVAEFVPFVQCAWSE